MPYRLILTLFFALAFPFLAAAQTPACRTPNDLVHRYGPDDGAMFQFDSAQDVAGIVAQLSKIAGGPPPAPPVVIMLTLDLDRGFAEWWLYNGNGCFITHMGPEDPDETQQVLDAANVSIPHAVPLPGTGGRGPGI